MARLRLGETPVTARAPHGNAIGREGLLCIRPHALALTGDEHENQVTGVVREVSWHGERHSLALEISGEVLRLNALPMRAPPQPGTSLTVYFYTDDATLIAEDEDG